MKVRGSVACFAFGLAAMAPSASAAMAGPWWLQHDATAPPAPIQAAVSAPAAGDEIARLETARRTLALEMAAARASLEQADTRERQAALEVRLLELEQRLRALEAELAALRAAGPVSPRQGSLDPPGLTPLDLFGQTSQVTSARSFNPAISVIPDGVYYTDNRRGAAAAMTAAADGFHAHGESDGGHAHGGGLERGFNLRELEVTFSGAVDPYFDVWAVVAIGGGEAEAEEVYVQTRKSLPGLQARFGKFYSGIGYLNRQHPHQWDFADQALPLDLLFGGALNEVGLQLTYLPRLPVYLQLGFEALQGENERVAQHIGPEDAPYFRDMGGPRLFTSFARVAPDLGYSSALQVGFSIGRSRLHQELHDEDEDDVPDEAFDGATTIWGAEAVYKYDSGKMYGKGDLTLQAEYLRRIRSLNLVAEAGEALRDATAVRFVQDGLYAQAVYGFAPRWTAGLRFDVAGLANRIEDEEGRVDLGSSRRFTANVTFNPTEFSRLRVQYGRGNVAVGGERQKYNQLWVQFQMSLGAHGAHAF